MLVNRIHEPQFIIKNIQPLSPILIQDTPGASSINDAIIAIRSKDTLDRIPARFRYVNINKFIFA